MKNPVIWFEIYVQDINRAVSFYEAVLEIKLDHFKDESMEMWTFPVDYTGHGATGAIIQMEGVKSGYGGTRIYFDVSDCEANANRARENGGTVVLEKSPAGESGSYAVVADPDGNEFGLYETNQ